jgi:predicted DNA repair protein MutK
MVWSRLGTLGRPLVVMLAVILMLVLVDVGIVAMRLTSGHPVGSQQAGQQQDKNAGKHPCNHGSEVSKAAHQHKGGKNVSGVAKSNAGKNGSCSSTSSQGGSSEPDD